MDFQKIWVLSSLKFGDMGPRILNFIGIKSYEKPLHTQVTLYAT